MCESYFQEVRKIISGMTDEEFIELLCRAGLEIEIEEPKTEAQYGIK